MFKKIIICIVLMVMTPYYVSADIKEQQEEYLDFVQYYYIFLGIFPSGEKTTKKLVEGIYPKVIKEYKTFIKNRPDSFLADEAKLRIAELYNLSGNTDKISAELLKPTKQKIHFNKNWRQNANFWLLDIVKNHPKSKHFSLRPIGQTEEDTASFALFFLGLWNKDISYWEKLLSEYPQSKSAKDLGKILKTLEHKKRK